VTKNNPAPKATTTDIDIAPTTENTAIQYSWKDPRFREILLDRQLYNESGFDPDVISGTRVSSAGALGIAQFMPGTWSEMIRKGYVPEGSKPTDVEHALKANYQYMTDLYNSPIVQEAEDEEERIKRTLAGYNAGPGYLLRRITEAKKQGVPWITLFKPETQKYVDSIPKDAKLYMSKGNYKSQFDRSKYNK
jgi:soluble lytic murein transglycosylase-like protein